MESRREAVRVLISSTFRDMHAEHGRLVRFRLPERRERWAKAAAASGRCESLLEFHRGGGKRGREGVNANRVGESSPPAEIVLATNQARIARLQACQWGPDST